MERKPASADIFLDKNGISHVHPELEVELMTRHREMHLVQQSIDGNTEAFGLLAEYNRRTVHKHVFRMVGNDTDAEDLVSSTFENAFKAIPRYQITGAPFSSWIMRIAHNTAISHLRTKREQCEIHEGIVDRKGSVEPHTQAEFSEDIERVKESLLQLNERYQKAILMKQVQGLSYKEVADELGVSVGNARVVVFRGLKKLRQNLGELNTIDLQGEGVA